MRTKITKRVVDAAKPGEKDTFLWDSELAGFGCKITPKGRRVYVIQYRSGGRTRRYTIGRHGPLTAEEARNQARLVLGEVAKGNDPASSKRVARSSPTVSELSERFLADYAQGRKKPRSIKEDRRMLDKYVLPAIGKRLVVDLGREDIVKLHTSLKETPYQANRVLALVSKIMNLSERWGIRPDATNPCRHVERFKERPRERYLSSEELARLGDVLTTAEANGSECPSVILAIRLLILTGCRMNEILTLRWEWVDFEHGCLRLPDSKTGSKLVPLGEPALALLTTTKASRNDDNPHVIPGRCKGAHLVNAQKPWRRIRQHAGLDGVRIHDLRHLYASVAASAGMGLPIIGAILGHRHASTTARYAHLYQDPLKQAADRVAGEIADALVNGTGARSSEA